MNEYDLLLDYDFNGNLFVDVGAHIGNISLKFAERGWEVIAFEPERELYVQLKRNLAGFKNVTCIQKAISDKRDRVPFYISDTHWGIHSFKPFHKTHKLAYEVEAIPLMELGLDMTFLKIDTEGADFLVLKGCDFNHKPELIIAEFMDNRSQPYFGYTHHDMAGYMSKHGYATFVSEWEVITEYSRKDYRPERKWLQLAPYPLDHEPAWGNLIFVQDKEKFKKWLKNIPYLCKNKIIGIGTIPPILRI